MKLIIVFLLFLSLFGFTTNPKPKYKWKGKEVTYAQYRDSLKVEYKKMYKTDIVRRGTTKENNYSPEGVAQMKRQNLFNPSK